MTEPEHASEPGQFGTSQTIGIIGGLLTLLGAVGAIVILNDMSDSGGLFNDAAYTSVDKWLAVLAAATVSALGCVVMALGAVVNELRKRSLQLLGTFGPNRAKP